MTKDLEAGKVSCMSEFISQLPLEEGKVRSKVFIRLKINVGKSVETAGHATWAKKRGLLAMLRILT